YHPDHGVREDLVTAILEQVPPDKVIFEAPRKNQQAWFVRQLGADVNLGNVAPASVLALETLRLALSAGTAEGGALARQWNPGSRFLSPTRLPGPTGAFPSRTWTCR